MESDQGEASLADVSASSSRRPFAIPDAQNHQYAEEKAEVIVQPVLLTSYQREAIDLRGRLTISFRNPRIATRT
jgi:hypothetical protein